MSIKRKKMSIYLPDEMKDSLLELKYSNKEYSSMNAIVLEAIKNFLKIKEKERNKNEQFKKRG